MVVVGFFAMLEAVLWAYAWLGITDAVETFAVPSEATQRVVVVGDSVAVGTPLGLASSFPAQMSRLPQLSERGSRVEVIGRPGLHAKELLSYVQQYLGAGGMGGVTVLALAGHNDCNFLQDVVKAPPMQGRNWFRHVTYWARTQVGRARSYRLLTQILHRSVGLNDASPQTQQDQLARCEGLVADGHRAARSFVEGAGGRFATLTYPIPGAWPESGHVAVSLWINDIATSLAQEEGLEVLDPTACVVAAEARSSIPLFAHDGLHMSELGYGELARCVAEQL